MGLYAAFVNYKFGSLSWTSARYVGHVYGSRATDARKAARERFNVRSSDHVVVLSDNGRKRWYGIRGAYPSVTSRFL